MSSEIVIPKPISKPSSTTPTRVPSSPSESHHISAVIGTSDDAATSKLSAALLGYFQDDYLKYFVSSTTNINGNIKPNSSSSSTSSSSSISASARRPPLINRG